MEKVIKEIRKFNDDRDWSKFHTIKNLAIALSVEASELLELFTWNENADIRSIRSEVADIYIYLLTISDMLQINIENVILNKLEENGKKYPIEKTYRFLSKHNLNSKTYNLSDRATE